MGIQVFSNILQLRTMLPWIALCICISVLLMVYFQGRFLEVGLLGLKLSAYVDFLFGWWVSLVIEMSWNNQHSHQWCVGQLFSHSLRCRMCCHIIFKDLYQSDRWEVLSQCYFNFFKNEWVCSYVWRPLLSVSVNCLPITCLHFLLGFASLSTMFKSSL